MTIGFIGLGKMGSRIVHKLLQEGHEVVVWNRSKEPIENLKSLILNHKSKSGNLKIGKSIEQLIKSLKSPRIVWVMVTAEATENILSELSKYVEPDDIIIDGGNSFYKDTEKRYKLLSDRAIKFLGIGVSGGLIGAEEGYPLMVGGDKSAYLGVQPLLESLAKVHGGHEYFGEGGAGHFVKMIHNGIEYGIMQSLGEGFEVLEKAPYKLDLLKIAKLWQKGTLVSGFLLDRTAETLKDDPHLENLAGIIETSGEAEWTVNQAKEEGVAVEIIERSLAFRKRSKTEQKVQRSFTARLVAALRRAFGGHAVLRK